MQKNVQRKSLILNKYDIILALALLITALGLFFVFKALKKDGNSITIKQGNKTIGTYSLSEDREIDLHTFYSDNVVVIENGQAYMKSSSCKDHICEKMGKISRKGENIICLPNEVFITVTDGKDSDIDGMAR